MKKLPPANVRTRHFIHQWSIRSFCIYIVNMLFSLFKALSFKAMNKVSICPHIYVLGWMSGASILLTYVCMYVHTFTQLTARSEYGIIVRGYPKTNHCTCSRVVSIIFTQETLRLVHKCHTKKHHNYIRTSHDQMSHAYAYLHTLLNPKVSPKVLPVLRAHNIH